MKIISLLLILSFVAVCLGSTLTWDNCQPNTFNVTSMTMNPDPAVPGKSLTFTGTANQQTDITGGTWSTTVYLGGAPLQTFTGNNCQGLLPNCPCPCNGPVTNQAFTLTVPVSIATPHGATLNGKLTAVDSTNTQFACVTYQFNVK
eukprot:TRINITY_DN10970_c0_g1_i1.p1 TRINITY_DN10970_c0_g1~~TRINITY_DN10970_c0_g1_i1.p1  ORF type:complete len:146 (-),score=19.21 TRINITY_DN10970_c0_g1_i1:161-598(-)